MCTAPCQGNLSPVSLLCLHTNAIALIHILSGANCLPCQIGIILLESLIDAQPCFDLQPVTHADLSFSVTKSILPVSDAEKLADNVLATKV